VLGPAEFGVLSGDAPEKLYDGERLPRKSVECMGEELADMAENVGDGESDVAAEVERLLMLTVEGRRVGSPSSRRTEVRIMASSG